MARDVLEMEVQRRRAVALEKASILIILRRDKEAAEATLEGRVQLTEVWPQIFPFCAFLYILRFCAFSQILPICAVSRERLNRFEWGFWYPICLKTVALYFCLRFYHIHAFPKIAPLEQ